jgi:MFS family permease
MLSVYEAHYEVGLNVPLLSFLVIACGGIACVLGGLLSQRFGTKRMATTFLFLSFICCSLSPFFLLNSSSTLFVGFLFFWGLVVIADSPLFSTLVAQNAPEGSRGASLTMVNCIGFSITILSIQLINVLNEIIDLQYVYMVLGIGPLLGLFALVKKEVADPVEIT